MTTEMDAETLALIIPPFTKAREEHRLWSEVRAALREVYDPEVPVNIYELGLFYKIFIDDETNDVFIDMTLTSPMCPVAGEMPGMVEDEVKKVEGIGKIKVNIVWDPPWEPSMMAETAKLQLNMF